MGETILLDYGSEEGTFYMQHIKRTEPFETATHYHGTYEIYYLLSGQRAYFIKDTSYQVSPGDLLFIPKSVVHNTSNIGSPEHERIVINFNDHFLETQEILMQPDLFASFFQQVGVLHLKLPEQTFVQSIMNKLMRELSDKPAGYELYIKLLLAELLIFAGRYSKKHPNPLKEHSNSQHRKISEIVRYMNKNFREPITLNHLSEKFYISPYYLSHIFKEVTGFTFIEYLNTTRLREAQKLLKETPLKIIEIAEAVGIHSLSHFGRIFKQLAGTTPLKYRKERL